MNKTYFSYDEMSQSARSTRATRSLKIDLTVLNEEENEDNTQMDVDQNLLVSQEEQHQHIRKSTVESQRLATLLKAQENKHVAVAKRSEKKSLEKRSAKIEKSTASGHDDLNDLLLKTLESDKGQKTAVKKLYTDRLEVLTNCKVDLMRRCVWTSNFMSILDGQKLVGYFISKIGFESTEKLICKLVYHQTKTTKSHLHGIGEALMIAWKIAEKNDETASCTAIERIWTLIVRESILMEGAVGQKFAEIARSLKSLDRSRFDPFLYRVLSPIIATYINSVNSAIRFEVSKYVFDFYPLLPEDQNEREETILTFLKDECVEIRSNAVIRVLEIINVFWQVTPMEFVRAVMEQLIDQLANDSHPSVRSSVYKSIRQLYDCAGGVNILEHALKCVVEKGLNDKNEKVRQSCVNLLYAIKSHRFIRYFDIIDVDVLLARFEVETCQAAIEPFVKLLFGSYHPKNSAPCEKLKRLNHLIKKGGRNAALNFHRLIFPLNLISVIDATNLLKFMMHDIYKRWKHGVPVGFDITSISLEETVGNINVDTTTVNPIQDVMSVERERELIMFECLLVMWRSIAKELEKPEYAAQAQSLEQLGLKFFKRMYLEFKNDPSIGATMALGCMLKNNYMESVAGECLQVLLDGKVAEDAVVPYLSFISTWKLKDIFRAIITDLRCLSTVNEIPSSPPRKKGRKIEGLSSEEAVQRAINFLRHELCVRSINVEMIRDNVFELNSAYESFAPICGIIQHFLSGPALECPPISGKLIVEVFEMKIVLNGLLMCSARMESKDALPLDHYLLDFQNNIEWSCEYLLPLLDELLKQEDSRWLIGFQICEAMLNNIPEKLVVCEELAEEERTSKSERPRVRDASAIGLHSNVEANISGVSLWQTVIAAYIDLLTALTNKDCPLKQLVPVIDAAKMILLNSQKFRNLSTEMISCAVRVACVLPEWIHNLGDQIDDADDLPRSLLATFRAIFEGQLCTASQKEKVMGSIVRTLLIERIAAVENVHNVGDPRELDFEVTSTVSLIMHKTIFRCKQMQKQFASNALTLFGSAGTRSFLPEEQVELDKLVFRIGAAAQIAYLSDMTVLKRKTNKSDSTLRRNSEEVKHMIYVLRKRMAELMSRDGQPLTIKSGDTVIPMFKDDTLRSQVKELIEYEEDTAF